MQLTVNTNKIIAAAAAATINQIAIELPNEQFLKRVSNYLVTKSSHKVIIILFE